MTGPVRVHRAVSGPPDAPPLVLSHAIGTSLAMWEPQLPALEKHFRVIRYDHRGHGASPVPPGPYDIADLGGDLLALLDDLGIERASICGLSLGAMTGLWVAAHAPERVERLVACCASVAPRSRQAWADRPAAVRAGGTAAVADLVTERWGYRDRRPDLAARIVAMLLATPAEGYAGCCDAIQQLDLAPDLGAIVAPTLAICGADDPSAPPEDARLIASGVADGRAEVVPDAAHLLNVERPEAVTALILQHLGAPARG